MILKTTFSVIAFLGLFLFIGCSAKKNELTPRSIEFNFYHSMRIPYQTVNIVISEQADSIVMVVTSSPSPYVDDLEKWEYSRQNYSKRITVDEFKELYKSLDRLSRYRLRRQKDYFGNDGTTWYIKWGSQEASEEFVIWSPDYDTQKRKIQDFLDVCVNILELSDLPKDDIL